MTKALAFLILVLFTTIQSQNIYNAIVNQGPTYCSWDQFIIGLQNTLENNTLSNTTKQFSLLAACDNTDFTGKNLSLIQVEYHVLPGIVNSSTLIVNDAVFKTTANLNIRINVYQTGNYINGLITFLPTLTTNPLVSPNGLIYGLTDIIPLPTATELLDIATSISQQVVSVLTELAPFANVISSLLPTNGTTLYAPTNTALAYFPPYLYRYFVANPNALIPLLQNHIVYGTWYLNSLSPTVLSVNVNTLNNQVIAFTRTTGPIEAGYRIDNNPLPLSGLDLHRTNGVIQPLDYLMIPSGFTTPLPTITLLLNATETAYFTSDFLATINYPDIADYPVTTVFSLLQQDPTLLTASAVNTFFVPVDTAGNIGTLDTALLAYHLLPGQNLTAEMLGTDELWNATDYTSGPNWFRFNTYSTNDGTGDVFYAINGFAKIIRANIVASNGIIHIIDQVLYPPCPANAVDNANQCGTSVDIVNTSVQQTLASSNFTTFYQLFQNAGLQLPNPVTIYVPSQAAFGSLAQYQMNYLTSNASHALLFLQYHIVAGTHLAIEVPISPVDHVTLTTLAGVTISVRYIPSPPGTIIVGSTPATITYGPLLRTNGVVFGIDAFLIPSSFWPPPPPVAAPMLPPYGDVTPTATPTSTATRMFDVLLFLTTLLQFYHLLCN